MQRLVYTKLFSTKTPGPIRKHIISSRRTQLEVGLIFRSSINKTEILALEIVTCKLPLPKSYDKIKFNG